MEIQLQILLFADKFPRRERKRPEDERMIFPIKPEEKLFWKIADNPIMFLFNHKESWGGGEVPEIIQGNVFLDFEFLCQ